MFESYRQRFNVQPAFPTDQHRAAAEAVVDYLAPNERVQAVFLTCSCARGKAAPESCLDMVVLLDPQYLAAHGQEEQARLEAFVAHNPACQALQKVVRWGGVELDFGAGEFAPGDHGYTTGPDYYEVEIGNFVAWAHPLMQRGARFQELQERWLPYYGEEERAARLKMVMGYAANNLDHIVPYARRGLLEQSFKRLYHAFEEYLQALFIQRRIYPIAYDKWLHEQLAKVLGEPELYEELVAIIAMPRLTVARFRDRERRLRTLLEQLR